MFKKVLLKTVLHVFLLKSKLLFLVSKNSELKAKFLFKNKATKSNKNVPSLGSNVVGVVLGGNVAVGVSLGGSPAVGVNSGVVGIQVDGHLEYLLIPTFHDIIPDHTFVGLLKNIG